MPLVTGRDAATSISEDSVFYVITSDGTADYKTTLSLLRSEIFGIDSSVTVAAADRIYLLDTSSSPQVLGYTTAQAIADLRTLSAADISDQTQVTAVSTDYVLVLDTSESPQVLKKALVSDLAGTLSVSDIMSQSTATVAGGDQIPIVDVSDSPQTLKRISASDFATAAQGTAADAALPKSGGEMTGNITMAGAQTVDGRDLSADGSKLDNIEANADVTDTANVTAAGAVMDSEVSSLSGIKTLTVPDSTTISAFGATLIDDASASAARTTLDVDQAGTDNSTDVTLAGTPDYITISGQEITRGQIDLTADVTGTLPTGNQANQTESIIIACSDETTDLTTGTAKVTFRMPYAFTLTDVRASVTTAPVGSAIIVDINEKPRGTSPEVSASILSSLIYIDANQYSSEDTSESPQNLPVISDTALGDDAEITIDIDQIGASTAGAGLKVELIGTRT